MWLLVSGLVLVGRRDGVDLRRVTRRVKKIAGLLEVVGVAGVLLLLSVPVPLGFGCRCGSIY